MRTEAIKTSVYSDQKAWDIIWKWQWFAKDNWQASFRKSKEVTCSAIESLLKKMRVRDVFDCSCGLGLKTIILDEKGYDVIGSDGSAIAVKYARQLSKEEGKGIKFFRARWEELASKCRYRFDCVYNDAFAWITTQKSLKESAKGIYSVLDSGGKFVFVGADQWSEGTDKQKIIETAWKRTKRFEILPPYEKDGVKLTVIKVREKTAEGIVDNHIYIVEERGALKVEIASVTNLCKWTWIDYKRTLRNAGFTDVYSIRVKAIDRKFRIFNVAVK